MKCKSAFRGIVLLIIFVLSACAKNAPVKTELEGIPDLSRDNFNFVIASDMGRRGESEQRRIADVMGKAAEANNLALMAVAGDPIHDEGVQSVDDPEWQEKIENIYTAPSLHTIPWYVVAGNHEYRGNVQALLDYSAKSERWNMPARYFSLEKPIGTTKETCLLVFIDTTPLIDKYRSGTEPDYADSDAGRQDIDAQLAWIERALVESNARWKIVIGHHPVFADTGKDETERLDMRRRLLPILERYAVNLYVCGHIHNFQYLRLPEYSTAYVVNSSASRSREAKPVDGTVFCDSSPGFSLVSVSPATLDFYMINYEGRTIYRFTLDML
ncbi:MAG: metallophosphoesterase [Treponemataceae bacterium]|nr:MAG: metallophosphoesterase [Treponemataceae bacterium]